MLSASAYSLRQKSRLAISLSCTLCLFREGLAIGFGSRKEEYVDRQGSPKSLFWKGRQFLQLLPPEFLFGWSPRHAPREQECARLRRRSVLRLLRAD